LDTKSEFIGWEIRNKGELTPADECSPFQLPEELIPSESRVIPRTEVLIFASTKIRHERLDELVGIDTVGTGRAHMDAKPGVDAEIDAFDIVSKFRGELADLLALELKRDVVRITLGFRMNAAALLIGSLE